MRNQNNRGVGGWFFEDFEHGIGGTLAQAFDVVEDKHAPAPFVGAQVDVCQPRTHRFDTHITLAGGFFGLEGGTLGGQAGDTDIGVIAFGNPPTTPTIVTGGIAGLLTVEGLRQAQRQQRLADMPRATQQIGVGRALGGHGMPEHVDRPMMSHDPPCVMTNCLHSYFQRRKAITALMPPKPNELLKATSIRAGRATLGT